MLRYRLPVSGANWRRVVRCLAGVAGRALAGLAVGAATEIHEAHDPAAHDHAAQGTAGGDAADPHAHHRHMMEHSSSYARSVHDYRLPDVRMVAMDGQETSLFRELDRGKPVLLNFIFTTCTTICPVLTATFAQVQRELGAERDNVRIISISIDPEHDTPARLREYAARFHAGPEWMFFTGRLQDMIDIQRAFDAYRGDKMNHAPLTFLRAAAGESWVRLDGFASAADVLNEYRHLTAH